MAEAIRGTVNGTVAVAVAEGAIIGIAYVLAGVPHPLLFAVLTIAFAMVPFGAWVAFSSAALVLVLHGGSLSAAAGLFGFGAAAMLELYSARVYRGHPFTTIAAKPDFDAAKLAYFLLDPHPKMPNMQLSRTEAADLAAYIASLK
jgi:hypothetical protein